ncbi:PFL family protein [Methanonatronarchaeum sp. AMET-Sl]|uniref:PFL family protein n=1 Tax=Methanonatronarchaeum sp. AMET-Sl TaxID=3037654 RepID=UPI00244DF641|nr:PFL family protein [Methanonatronarchaeum sp. AMET-Sl]WGI16775.1 PFL family protein [Methanonatronarchaeum sp. AMET-Sl]
MISSEEIFETIDMVAIENLDIRTVTLGINIGNCSSSNPKKLAENVKQKIIEEGRELSNSADRIESRYGIPIVNRRISVSPVGEMIGPAINSDPEVGVKVALAMDDAAREIGVDFIGGYSALVDKGMTNASKCLLDTIPQALAQTERVCSSVEVASTRSGINMDAVKKSGMIVKETSQKTSSEGGIGSAKLGFFANAPPDNPFMPGAMHGAGNQESSISVAISGPGVVRSVVETTDGDFSELSEAIKKTSFKMTRAGELIGKKVAEKLDVDFNIVDLSLAPTPAEGDSVAEILERMGIEGCGAPGSTAALALLTDAVKKGGMMATANVGGLSGSFIPVTEDAGMARAVKQGSMNIEKLEAMSSVCSVGLDMVPIPGDTSIETISAIIADECAIGMMNNKTTGIRLIPVPGKKAGETVSFGGLLGESTIMSVSNYKSMGFVERGGRIPAPIHSLKN